MKYDNGLNRKSIFQIPTRHKKTANLRLSKFILKLPFCFPLITYWTFKTFKRNFQLFKGNISTFRLNYKHFYSNIIVGLKTSIYVNQNNSSMKHNLKYTSI